MVCVWEGEKSDQGEWSANMYFICWFQRAAILPIFFHPSFYFVDVLSTRRVAVLVGCRQITNEWFTPACTSLDFYGPNYPDWLSSECVNSVEKFCVKMYVNMKTWSGFLDRWWPTHTCRSNSTIWCSRTGLSVKLTEGPILKPSLPAVRVYCWLWVSCYKEHLWHWRTRTAGAGPATQLALAATPPTPAGSIIRAGGRWEVGRTGRRKGRGEGRILTVRRWVQCRQILPSPSNQAGLLNSAPAEMPEENLMADALVIVTCMTHKFRM